MASVTDKSVVLSNQAVDASQRAPSLDLWGKIKLHCSVLFKTTHFVESALFNLNAIIRSEGTPEERNNFVKNAFESLYLAQRSIAPATYWVEKRANSKSDESIGDGDELSQEVPRVLTLCDKLKAKIEEGNLSGMEDMQELQGMNTELESLSRTIRKGKLNLLSSHGPRQVRKILSHITDAMRYVASGDRDIDNKRLKSAMESASTAHSLLTRKESWFK